MSKNFKTLKTTNKELNITDRIHCFITMNNSGFYCVVEFSGKVHGTVDKFINFVINILAIKGAL